MSTVLKKRVMITGGTGYLGSNIINNLKHKFEFVLIKRKSSNLNRIAESISQLEVYDIEYVDEELIRKLDVDILLHCATHYGRKDSDPINIIQANLILPLNLISLFKRAGKPVRFINTDTILDKNINVYSLSKSQFKEWMQFFSNESIYINIQLEHFYGPMDDKSKFVSFLVDAFIKEVSHLDLTFGEQNRYFTYIDDVVLAFEIVLENIKTFNVGFTEFQVSSDEPVKLKAFIEMVKGISGNEKTKLNFGAIPYRNGEMMNFKVDTSAIKNLGWVSLTSLEEGLLKTITIEKEEFQVVVNYPL